jgi:Ca-activated chloride channel homolog
MKLQRIKVLLVILMSCPVIQSAAAAEADRSVLKANVLYHNHKYDEAKQLYEKALSAQPGSAAINYNLGTAQFKTGDYANAVQSFEKALASENRTLEFKANYNVANSKFKEGMLKKENDQQAAVQLFKESLDNYKRAIDLNPGDEDAKINYEFVDKVLKELKDKPQENKRDQSKQNEQKEEKNSSSGSGAQESNKDRQAGADKQDENKGSQGQENKDKKNAQEEKQNQEKNGPQSSPGQDKKDAGEPLQEQKAQENDQNKGQQGNPEDASAGEDAQDMKEMSGKEAKMLLDGYKQEENMQGQLKDTDNRYQEEVVKDW